MSALGHYIEDEGIATTGISLIREHTEGMRPPRFLWVPFELGRPLGAPNNPEFQTKVLRESLALLESSKGPVLLQDFNEDAPLGKDQNEDEQEGWTCPINLPPPRVDRSEREAALIAEIASLAPWYELAKRNRGGSSVGASRLPIDEVARALVGYLDGNRENRQPEVTMAESLKVASEDIKAWYMEAATAQPGAPTSKQIADWFWGETSAGLIFLDLQKVIATSDDPKMQYLATKSFIPRSQRHRLNEK